MTDKNNTGSKDIGDKIPPAPPTSSEVENYGINSNYEVSMASADVECGAHVNCSDCPYSECCPKHSVGCFG
jgi:hypothetical protein